jgi:hypothetical protein
MKIKFMGTSHVDFLTPYKEYEVFEYEDNPEHGMLCCITDDDGDTTSVGLSNSSLIEGAWTIVPEGTLPVSDNPVVQDRQIKDTNPKDLIGSKKAKLSVIPAGVMFEIGLGLLEGACKYGRHNYRAAGVRSSVYYDATLGHLMDWWEGQDIDPESGLNHVTKALSSLTVLRDAMLQDMLTDDRPPRSKVFKSDFNDKAASIIELHSDKNPKHYTQKDI